VSTLNAYVGNAWVPVDLRGPIGNQGPVGAAGTFTWPGSTFQNYTNYRTGVADGINEPGPLTAVDAGTTPATRVLASNTSRIEAISAGLLLISAFFQCSSGATNNNWWINIRTVTNDGIIAAGYLEMTDLWGSISALYSAAAGEQFKFIYGKVTGNAADMNHVIRTALIT